MANLSFKKFLEGEEKKKQKSTLPDAIRKSFYISPGLDNRQAAEVMKGVVPTPISGVQIQGFKNNLSVAMSPLMLTIGKDGTSGTAEFMPDPIVKGIYANGNTPVDDTKKIKLKISPRDLDKLATNGFNLFQKPGAGASSTNSIGGMLA
jgi:hypothetical protein